MNISSPADIFKNRLTELVRTSNMLIFWGRPIHELHAVAMMAGSTVDFLSYHNDVDVDYELNPLSKRTINADNNDVVIVEALDVLSHQMDYDCRTIITNYCTYQIRNDRTKVIYITNDNEEQIKQWDLLREPCLCRTIRFREPVPIEILHEFIEF